MGYCKNCGKELEEGAVFCNNCGTNQTGSNSMTQNGMQNMNPNPASQNNYNQQNVVDNGGFGWGLLGCCIPIAGLILFLVWKDTKPKTAKAAGIGALVSVIIGVIYYIIVAILGIGVALGS